MSFDTEFIEDLIIKEITGSITPSEQIILNQTVENYPAAWALRRDLRAKLMVTELESKLHQLSEEVTAQHIVEEAARRRRTYKKKWLASTAVAACLIGFICYRYGPLTALLPDRNLPTLAATEKAKSVTLLLPGGEAFTLDSTSKQLQKNDIAISTHRNTLSLEARTSNVGLATVIVPPGKDYKIHLQDGSEIHLNSGTRLQFALQFTGDKREITLQGEAYIIVAPQPDKPFFVHLPHGKVQVLGTQFNINTYDSGVHKLALINGAVKFNAFNDSTVLKPGREAISTPKGLKTGSFDASEVLAWRNGKYYFFDATLAEVSRVLTRWYGITVTIENKDVAEKRFTGMVDKTQGIEVTLKGLQSTNVIRYYTDDEGVVHIK